MIASFALFVASSDIRGRSALYFNEILSEMICLNLIFNAEGIDNL